jgi:phosphate transport system protein
MAQNVRAMVRDSTDSFVELDAEKAVGVIARDDEIDNLYTAVFHHILVVMKRDPEAVRDGIHVLSVAKWLERIADHATNLAEQAVFSSKGTDIRHPDKLGR